MADRPSVGLLDTSVVIDLDKVELTDLPPSLAVFAITLAELSAGPTAARDPRERARRQDRLQRVEAAFEALPFDANAARAFGRVAAAERAEGRQPRRRLADLLIGSIALAEELQLVTRNPSDFSSFTALIDVVTV